MPKKKEPTVQQHVAEQLRSAETWCRDAHQIITTRADRVDALDSIQKARQYLDHAEGAIRATFKRK